MNYFELFSIEPEFQIDLSKLRKSYYIEAKKAQMDEEKMTLINSAYETLKDSFSRLAYMLGLQGLTTTHQDLPQSFLMEMMEWNEQLEEAETDEAKEALFVQMDEKEKEIWYNINQMNFKENPDWIKIQENYFFLKYILRNKENLRNIAS